MLINILYLPSVFCINDFMKAAIDWILGITNQQISETLPGATVWRHLGSQK